VCVCARARMFQLWSLQLVLILDSLLFAHLALFSCLCSTNLI